MNMNYEYFTKVISNSIRNTYTNLGEVTLDFDEILKIVDDHKVEGIFYFGLKKSNVYCQMDKNQMNKFFIKVFNAGVTEKRNMKLLIDTFNLLKEKNISFIALKGVVLKNLYHHPEIRTMSDADLLINMKDLKRVTEVLENEGYILLNNEASHHAKFYKNGYPVLEIHWNVIRRDGFSNNIEAFENDIWNRSISINIGDCEVRALSYEDMALHLCMHMASHITAHGFGIRQLCDFVLLVEKKGHCINWNNFRINAKNLGFDKFSMIIFEICNKVFNMNVPEEFCEAKNLNEKYINNVIEEIILSGVYGKKDMVNSFGTQVAFNYNGVDKNVTTGALRRYLRFIFPSYNTLKTSYSYLKRYKFLLPIAWIQHFGKGIFNKNYRLKEKLLFMLKGPFISIRRNKMLKWMEI